MLALLAGLLVLSTPALAQTAPPADSAQDGLVYFKDDDARMNAAIAEAKRRLPDFFVHLASPAADERAFGVKFDIVPGDKAEYIWTHDLRRAADGTLTGALDDDAVMVAGKAGDRVTIPADRIADWGYFKGRVMQGNLTTRVILNRLDPGEAAAIRRAYGWR